MSKKYNLALDDYEHGLLIHALNDKRNELIQNGKSNALGTAYE